MCIVWTVGNYRAPHWNPTCLWWVSHCLTSQRCEIMRYVRTTWEYYILNIAPRSRRHLIHTVSHSTELMTERSDGTLTIRSAFLGSSSSQFSSQHGEAEPGSSQRVSGNASVWWSLGVKRKGGKEGNNRLVLKTATTVARYEVISTNTDKDRSQSFPLTVLYKRVSCGIAFRGFLSGKRDFFLPL